MASGEGGGRARASGEGGRAWHQVRGREGIASGERGDGIR